MLNKKKFDEIISKLDSDKQELAKLIVKELDCVETKIDLIRDKNFIKVNKQYPSVMKETAYSKLYIKLLQQKNLLVKTFNSIISKNVSEDDEDPMKDFKEALEKL